MNNELHVEDAPASPWPRLIVLGILIATLMTSLIVGSLGAHNRLKPDLALDLEGGTQIILTPVTTDGSEITDQDIVQAIDIIRQRVDATGVSEAEITSQGARNIVVGLPGQPSEETLDLVRTSAVLRLRPVLNYQEAQLQELGVSLQTPGESGELTEEQIQEATAAADLDGDGELSDEPATPPADASSKEWITEQLLYDMQVTTCSVGTTQAQASYDDPEKPMVACDPETGTGYLLGPAEMSGADISQASSGPRVNQQGQTIGGYQVNIEFTNDGGELFRDITARLVSLGYGTPQNLFSMVLDGSVISVASVQEPITGGSASISGSFTADQAAALANKLSFGSLPLTFQVQSEEQISATLGSEQLVNSLIAGAVGLVLIVLYLLWQYHGLGILAILSIALTTGMSYFVISGLSWMMGYRLSLAGVIGLIISIGISADSFIVFFERIRDEIREGRPLKAAVEYGWRRARQTILVSDAVNFVAAIVLYFLAVGGVRGFAFTLGLTTLIDLIVVMMFTYPIMRLLIKTKFFGEGHKLSGMSAQSLGADPAYIGRGQTRAPQSKKKKKASNKPYDPLAAAEAQVNKMSDPTGSPTLASRRAAQRRARKEGK